MKSLHTELVIDASPDKVWSILMDFKAYAEWNPFIRALSGEAREGGKLRAVIQLPESKSMTFKPKCLAAEENREFRWLGHLMVPGLFDGEHFFKVKELDGGKCKFIQGENFKGILIPLFWKQLKGKTVSGFEAMNKALKARAESLK